MKKYFLLFVMGLLFSPIFSASAESTIYSNSEFHYSFQLPDDWVEASEEQQNQFYEYAKEFSGGSYKKPISVFLSKDNHEFNYPYVILSEQRKANLPSYQEISDQLGAVNTDEMIDEVTYQENSTLESVINDIVLEKPILDKNHNVVIMNLTFPVEELNVSGKMLLFFGKESIVTLIVSMNNDDVEINNSIIGLLIKTFKFDEGYEFNKQNISEWYSSYLNEKVLFKFVVGAIIGLVGTMLFIIIRGLQLIERKVKENFNNEYSRIIQVIDKINNLGVYHLLFAFILVLIIFLYFL